MNVEDANDYKKVKKALLERFRLSAEAFRRRFPRASVGAGEPYTEYVFKLKANLVEWLKSAEAFGNHDGVVELIGLELFYKGV